MKSTISSVEAAKKECTSVCLLLFDSLGPSNGSVWSHLLL